MTGLSPTAITNKISQLRNLVSNVVKRMDLSIGGLGNMATSGYWMLYVLITLLLCQLCKYIMSVTRMSSVEETFHITLRLSTRLSRILAVTPSLEAITYKFYNSDDYYIPD